MTRSFRFLPFQEFAAATNMALDEAILEAHIQGQVPPTLRLYGFKPEAVSIGRTQNVPPEFVQRARRLDLDVVRRPTGGRAVLHQNELTYSFVGTSTDKEGGFLSTSILEAYKQICQGLQNALAILGINLEIGGTEVAYKHMHDCFLATTGSDLHYQGKKMIGSAQLRRKHGVLQHGSILLHQDQAVMAQIAGQDEKSQEGTGRHANLFDVLGRTVTASEFAHIFLEGFAKAFEGEFLPDDFLPGEREIAADLKGKYLLP